MNELLENVWEQYVAAWKAPKAEDKEALTSACLDGDCVYTDPLTHTQGRRQLLEYMQEFQQQIPGGHLVTTYFLGHHQKSIAKWNLLNGEGEVVGDGISYGEYNDDNKLVATTVFFQVPPQ